MVTIKKIGYLLFLAFMASMVYMASIPINADNALNEQSLFKTKIKDLTLALNSRSFQKIKVLKNQMRPELKKSGAVDDLIVAVKKQLSKPYIYNQLMSLLADENNFNINNKAYHLASSINRTEQVIGLDILSNLGVSNSRTLKISTQVICQSQDIQLIQLAISLYPEVKQSHSKTSNAVQCFNRLLTLNDLSIQSESLFKIAQLATTKDELLVVLSFLEKSNYELQMSAALAINQSRVFEQSLKQLLFNKLADFDASSELRIIIANHLKKFDLNENEINYLKSLNK